MSGQLDFLPQHDHVCVFYKDDQELEDLLTSYLAPGLRKGQKCLLMAPNQLSKRIIDRLQQMGIVFSIEQLECLTTSQSYLRVTPFQPDYMIKFLNEKLTEWLIFPYCRIAGETSWAMGDPATKQALFEYERNLNRLNSHPGQAIFCFYDLRVLCGYDIVTVLKTHPRVLFRGLLIDNPYYEPCYKNPKAEISHICQDPEQLSNLFGASLFNMFLSECTEPEQLAQLLAEAIPGILSVSTSLVCWWTDQEWQLEGLYESRPVDQDIRTAIAAVAPRIREAISSLAKPIVPLGEVLTDIPDILRTTTSLYVSPIRSNKHLFGFFIIGKNGVSNDFTSQETFLLSLLSTQAAITTENILLLKRNIHYICEIKKQQQKIAEQNDVLKRSEAIHRRLTDKVLNGEGIESIAKSLSEMIEKPVSVYNQYRCIAVAGRDLMGKMVQLEESEFSKFIRKVDIVKRAMVYQDRLLVAPVIVEHEVLGYVCVHSDERPSALITMAAQHAATAIAVEMLKMKVEEEVKRRLKTGLVDDLISGHLFNEQGFLQKAGNLGYDLSKPHIVVVGTLMNVENGMTDAVRQQKQEKIVRVLEKKFAAQTDIKKPKILLAEKGEQFILLVPSTCKNATLIDPQGLSKILETITDEEPDLLLGIGTECQSLSDYAASYRKAMRCIQVAQRFRIDRRCLAYEELGIWRLLSEMSNEQLFAFSQETLAGLLDPDQRGDQSLLETLGAYLKHNGCLKDAANELFVHVGTIKYRLQKISSILNCDLKDAHTRMTLQAALLIHRLFNGGKYENVRTPSASPMSRTTKGSLRPP